MNVLKTLTNAATIIKKNHKTPILWSKPERIALKNEYQSILNTYLIVKPTKTNETTKKRIVKMILFFDIKDLGLS